MTWEYPVLILVMFFVAGFSSWALLRAANRKQEPPSFACSVCGRNAVGATPRQWRYCPFCGAPKDAKHLHQMPQKRRSVIDLEE
jgi:hypothetical protein